MRLVRTEFETGSKMVTERGSVDRLICQRTDKEEPKVFCRNDESSHKLQEVNSLNLSPNVAREPWNFQKPTSIHGGT